MKVEQKKCTKKGSWELVSDKNLKDKAQLVLLFGGREQLKDEGCFKKIKDSYPNAQILGCSTAGEIISTEVLDNAFVVTAVFFEKSRVKLAKVNVARMEDSFKAGEELAEALDRDGLVHVFVLSDGLHVNGSDLARGMVSKLPANVAVTGGLAGDNSLFEETLVFLNDQPRSRVIAAIGFYGDDLKIGYGSMGGWTSFGQDRLVTRSKGNILYELDGRSALELYKEYLGDQAEGLPSTGLLFPLSLQTESGESRLVRTILAVDEKAGSMTFAGDVPEGAYVRLMKANLEGLIDGASRAANVSFEAGGKFAPDLAILISCVGRKLVLKQRVEEEIESVRDRLGKATAITGFYSYGEICPASSKEKKCELHNQTMTITTFSEK